MTKVYVDEVPSPRRIDGAPQRVAIIGRSHWGPRHRPVEVASVADLDRAFGGGASPLRRAVSAYVAQGGDPLLVVRGSDLSAALAALEDQGVTLLVIAPGLLRGREAEVHAWCVEHRCFLLADGPEGEVPAGLAENAAVYAPGLRGPAGRPVWTSAAVAGVVRRIDLAAGVWAAPAGEDAEIRGLTVDPEPASGAANLVRTTPDERLLVWGARTASSDPEWKYVNVRRLVLWLEESIDQGTRWAVFEPQDEPLWAAVRQSVGDFLHDLWRQGALLGTTPDEAFFVRCDRTTMTQNDLDNGRLICLVGIAPVRPAEFVILRFTHTVASPP
jgi:hypothetical protein